MNENIYQKLVDMYAGNELPSELKDELDAAAFTDPDLSHDLTTLTSTVRMVQEIPAPEFTEESFQRILMKMYARGADIEVRQPEKSFLQFNLPMQG
jgi:hypothetical protein